MELSDGGCACWSQKEELSDLTVSCALAAYPLPPAPERECLSTTGQGLQHWKIKSRTSVVLNLNEREATREHCPADTPKRRSWKKAQEIQEL